MLFISYCQLILQAIGRNGIYKRKCLTISEHNENKSVKNNNSVQQSCHYAKTQEAMKPKKTHDSVHNILARKYRDRKMILTV